MRYARWAEQIPRAPETSIDITPAVTTVVTTAVVNDIAGISSSTSSLIWSLATSTINTDMIRLASASTIMPRRDTSQGHWQVIDRDSVYDEPSDITPTQIKQHVANGGDIKSLTNSVMKSDASPSSLPSLARSISAVGGNGVEWFACQPIVSPSLSSLSSRCLYYQLTIRGAPDTPYDGGVFLLLVAYTVHAFACESYIYVHYSCNHLYRVSIH